MLDVARRLLMVEVEDGRLADRREENLPGTLPLAQAERLAELGPQILVCGAVSQAMYVLLTQLPMQVVPFVAGETETVIQAWLSGTLAGPRLAMPGCCRRGRRRYLGGPAWAGSGRGRFNRHASY